MSLQTVVAIGKPSLQCCTRSKPTSLTGGMHASRDAPKVLPALLSNSSVACATWNGALPCPSGWQAGASNHTINACCHEIFRGGT